MSMQMPEELQFEARGQQRNSTLRKDEIISLEAICHVTDNFHISSKPVDVTPSKSQTSSVKEQL